MTWVDKQRIQFDGEPVVMRAPVRMEVRSNVPLPPTALAEAAAAYQRFRNKLALSLLKYTVRRETLPCGVLMTIRSIQEHDVVRLYFSDKLRQPCLIPLESGVVDLIEVLVGPETIEPGILYRTTYVSDYIAAQGQFIGPLKVPDLVGEEPPDGAVSKAFPGSVAGKKVAAAQCPPSIFTGRARLWVQALYGAHPAMFRKYLQQGTDLSRTPYLLISGIELTTSTGVYLDPRTHGHWMIQINSGMVRYYPLIASECGERLRRLLGSTKLSDADKQRVEAYILSSSVPVLSKVQEVEMTETYPMTAMGYGWHFNYDGTKCDIVETVETVLPEFSGTGGGENVSTHYRMEHSLVSGTWECVLSVVESASWKTLTSRTAICSPLWSTRQLIKLGIVHGAQIPYGSAPFYVYYQTNVVQVVRYITSHDETEPERYSSPSYFGGDTPLRTPSRATLGSEAGEWYDTFDSKVDNTFIQVGSSVFDAKWKVATKQGERQSEKFGTPEDPVTSFAGFGDYPNGVDTAIVEPYTITSYGDANPSLPHPFAFSGSRNYITSAYSTYWPNHSGPWHYDTYTARDDLITRTITVIPFYDSEAVFVHREVTTDDSKAIDRNNYVSGIGAWVRRDDFFTDGGTGDPATLTTYDIASPPFHITPDSQEVRSEGQQVTESFTRLVTSKAGELTCQFNAGVEIFFDPLSYVIDETFSTRSSLNGSVYAKQKDVQHGVPSNIDSFGPITFVGWT